MSASRRLWLVAVLMLAGYAPAHAQDLPFRLPLPALYRPLSRASGRVMWLTTSRLAPDLAVSIAGTMRGGENLVYQILLSPDGGLSWQPTGAQPWQDVLAPAYWWSDMATIRILRVKGELTLVAHLAVSELNTLLVSTDLGQHWDARPVSAPAACLDFAIKAVVTSPAAPDRLIVDGRCQVASPDSWPILLVSSDAARTWAILEAWSAGEPVWAGRLQASPVDGDTLFRILSTHWQRTRDLTTSWENLTIPGDQLLLSPNDSQTLAVIGPSRGAGLTSRDGGATWQGWTSPSCADTVDQYEGPVWVRGLSEVLVALCVGGPLIRSTDGGQTWVERPLPEGSYPHLLAADDAHVGGLYLQMAIGWTGNDVRLYHSLDAGDTWQDVLALTGQ